LIPICTLTLNRIQTKKAILFVCLIFLFSCSKNEPNEPGIPAVNLNLDSIVGISIYNIDILRIVFEESKENWRMKTSTFSPGFLPALVQGDQYNYVRSSSVNPDQVLAISSLGDTSIIYLTYIGTPKGFKISQSDQSEDFFGPVLELQIRFEYNSTGDLLGMNFFGFTSGFSDYIQFGHLITVITSGNVREVKNYSDQDAVLQLLFGIQPVSYNPVLTERTEMDYDNNLNPMNNYYMPISGQPFIYSHFSSNNIISYSTYNSGDTLQFTDDYHVFADSMARPLVMVSNDGDNIWFHYSN